MRRPRVAGLVAGLALAFVAVPGCDLGAGRRLAIATTWPEAERRAIEPEFLRWLAERPAAAGGPARIQWLSLSPRDDLERLAARRDPPDVVLGGSARALDRLAESNRLILTARAGPRGWLAVQAAGIRPVAPPGDGRAETDPNGPGQMAFDDPRRDPIALARSEAQLQPEHFGAGYAQLVGAAGSRRRIGRGAADPAPAPALAPGDPAAGSIPWVEGAAILAGGREPTLAASFLDFLTETGRARPAPDRTRWSATDDLALLADLLGATLVDARDELRAAWSALERAGSPPNPLRWMTRPPPWPPASVATMLGRQDEPAMAMVETLTGQLTTDPSVRAWLVRSWLAPARPIDRSVLRELAGAVDGRLVREPRFREWLRAEWTAWARQRYRRVARAVASPRVATTPDRQPPATRSALDDPGKQISRAGGPSG